MVTMQWASVEHGDSAVRCLNVNPAFSSLFPTLQARSSTPATHYLLLPPPYSLLPTFTGAPKRASHALPSTLFSLLPTLEAHCKVTTHYLLLPTPYSLLWMPTAK